MLWCKLDWRKLFQIVSIDIFSAVAIPIYWNSNVIVFSLQCKFWSKLWSIHWLALGNVWVSFSTIRNAYQINSLGASVHQLFKTNYLSCLLFKHLRPPTSSSGCLFYRHFLLDKHRYCSMGRGNKGLQSVRYFKSCN